jgi:RNA recognition motif-containing protein
VTDPILFGFFTSFYPSILSAKVIYDLNSRKSKGYGFVKFSIASDFERSLKEMDGQKLLNKRIKVNQAQNNTKKPMSSSGLPPFSFSCPTNFDKNGNLGNFYQSNYPGGFHPQGASRPMQNFSNSENSFFSNLINVSNFENYYTENNNMYNNTANAFNFYNHNKTEEYFNKFPEEINSKVINKDICNNLLMKASADPYSSFVPFAPPKRSNGLTQFLYYYNIIQVHYNVDKDLKCYTENSKYGYTDSDSHTSDNRKKIIQ